MSNTLEELRRVGQSIWCDNLSRKMIESGELQRWIEQGVSGVTSNPTIFMKAITSSTDYDTQIQQLLAEDRDVLEVYERLVLPDIVDAADLLRPLYDSTDGQDGYVSLEVNPRLAYDTDATLAEARRLFSELDRPNVLIKVPATDEGIPAIETLIGEGVNVNVTLIFSRGMHEKVMQAYLNGLRHLDASGGNLSRVASVASFFVSRVDTLVDNLLTEKHQPNTDVTHLLGTVAIANAKLAYARFEQVFDAAGPFGELAAKGARVQRPLWASTGTKNPDYSPTKYIDGLVAPSTVNTLPPDTIKAAMKQASTEVTIRDDVAGARTVFEQVEKLGIRMEEVTDKLRTDGVEIFAKSFEELLASLAHKEEQLRAAG